MGHHLDIPAQAARKYGSPVVVIWGNHEPYGSIWPELRVQETVQLAQLHAEGLDVRVLHGAVTEIAGVRIIGTTLWTDLKLYPPLELLAPTMVSTYMQDDRAIRTAPIIRFSVDNMLEHHAQDKTAILKALSEPHEGPTLVMTHHLPVRELIAPIPTICGHEKHAMSAGFANALWDEIQSHDIHTWVWGQSHEGENWTCQGKHGPIKFITNQRGYPGENVVFDPAVTIEV